MQTNACESCLSLFNHVATLLHILIDVVMCLLTYTCLTETETTTKSTSP